MSQMVGEEFDRAMNPVQEESSNDELFQMVQDEVDAFNTFLETRFTKEHAEVKTTLQIYFFLNRRFQVNIGFNQLSIRIDAQFCVFFSSCRYKFYHSIEYYRIGYVPGR